MKKYFIESYNFLTEREKKKLVFFFFLTCGSTFFETLSIGALYPLFTALISNRVIKYNKLKFISPKHSMD